MDISKINHTGTLFLDRDGVINKRIFNGYVTSPATFEFLPGVQEGLKIFNRIFGKIIVVTNQQGVGKGLMTEEELQKIHDFMLQEVEKAGGRIDAVYYCTDLKDKERNCRKPAGTMADRAKKDFPEIDFENSIMAGDSESDILFGKGKGMTTVFIGEKQEFSNDIKPDYSFPSLFEFAIFLQKSINNQNH